ncbi:MAG: metallophosphoesterase [Syntrophales bacterium]|jgi:Icc-related predicted phosphoesterase
MKILAVADIHGRLSRLFLIEEYLDRCRPDALVIAGDMSRYGRPDSFFDWLHARDLPVITVRGNTDPRGLDKRMSGNPNFRLLHLEKTTLNGISFSSGFAGERDGSDCTSPSPGDT